RCRISSESFIEYPVFLRGPIVASTVPSAGASALARQRRRSRHTGDITRGPSRPHRTRSTPAHILCRINGLSYLDRPADSHCPAPPEGEIRARGDSLTYK